VFASLRSATNLYSILGERKFLIINININKPLENKIDFLINLKIFFKEKIMNIIKNPKLIFLVVTFFTLSLFTAISTPSAFACSCVMPGTPSEELKEATAVFSGTVIDIDRNLTGYGYKVKFDIEKIWKGISDKTVVVSTGMGGGDCGYGFKEGERYFVYAYGDDSLSANICSRTRLLSVAGEDLSVLGDGNAPLSQPNSPQGGGPLNLSNNLIFIIILAVIILGFIIYKVILSRKKVI